MAIILAVSASAIIPSAFALTHDSARPDLSFPVAIAAADPDADGISDRLGPAVAVGLALLSLVMLWWMGLFHPAALSHARSRNVAAHPWWVWLLAGILTFAAGVIGAGLGVGVRQAIGLPEDSIGGRGVVQLSSMAGAASAGGLLLRLLARATDGPGEALAAGLRFRWTDIPVGAGCFLLAAPLLACASMLAVAVHTRLVGEPPDPIAHAALRDMIDHQSSAWVWAVVGAAVVGAPLVEEIIYRVLLQSAFRALLRRPWTAIALTASVFALMHRGGEEPVPWHAVALLWCLGVALGVAYERTWRPGVPIVIHAMFNAVNVALAAGFAHKSG